MRPRTMAVFAFFLVATSFAFAETPAEKAKTEFTLAKTHYAEGRYKDAADALERAQALDPSAKDLVINLALVHEKMGVFDSAIADWQHLLEMSPSVDEQRKAEQAMKRLEGAKKDYEAKQKERIVIVKEIQMVQAPKHGRIDGWTIGAGVLGIAGLGVGTYFGLRAITTRPSANTITSGEPGSTYAALRERTESAHKHAVIADVAFGIGIAGVVGATLLYAMRLKHPGEAPQKAWVAPSLSGIVAGGTF